MAQCNCDKIWGEEDIYYKDELSAVLLVFLIVDFPVWSQIVVMSRFEFPGAS